MAEDNLDKILEAEIHKEFRPKVVKTTLGTPANIANMIKQATDENTERATNNMQDQLVKIRDGLIMEIEEVETVRRMTGRRLNNLQHALTVVKSALDLLEP